MRAPLTIALCLSLGFAPVTASAGPESSGVVKGIAAACMLYFTQLAGAQDPGLPQPLPPAAVKPAEVAGAGAPKDAAAPAGANVDPAKAAEAAKPAGPVAEVNRALVEQEKQALDRNGTPSVPTEGSGWSVVLKNLGAPFNQRWEVYAVMAAVGLGIGGTYRLMWMRKAGYVSQLEAVYAKRKELLAKYTPRYTDARTEFEAAAQGFHEAVERAAASDNTARLALIERAEAQMQGPAKDPLLARLRALAPPTEEGQPAPRAAVPEGPTVEEAYQVMAEKYVALRALYQGEGGMRDFLLANGVKEGELPLMPDLETMLRDVSEDMRQIMGLDKTKIQAKTVAEAIQKLDELTAKWINNQRSDSNSRLLNPNWLVPVTGIGLSFYPAALPLAVVPGLVMWRYWGANVRAKWRATLMFTLAFALPTSGFIAHQYFKGKEQAVEQADTRAAQRPIETRATQDWATQRYRDQEILAKSFQYAWERAPGLEGMSSPVKPSGNPLAPNPMSDIIQQKLDQAKAELEVVFKGDAAKEHYLELLEMVARKFANLSPEFGKLPQADQDALVKFLSKQMLAYPHTPPERPPVVPQAPVPK